MGNVILYSGIAAKIRAMRKNLLTEDDFNKLSQCGISKEKAEYLSTFKSYAKLFENIDVESLHRINVEQRLNLSMYQDFDKLYKFADMKQKQFMKLYFSHFGINMIKSCLRSINGGYVDKTAISMYKDFIQRNYKFDIVALSESRSLEEFINVLKNTHYYTILKYIYDHGAIDELDYEIALDMKYFNSIWKKKDKVLGKKDADIIAATLGSRIDMMNMNWIYRAKKYYNMDPHEIYAMLIPVRYRISAELMKKMVEAENLDAFMEAEKDNFYSARLRQGYEETGNLGEAQQMLLDEIYRRTAEKNPYSIAPINTYFFMKEEEINRIIRIIESTHYLEQT